MNHLEKRIAALDAKIADLRSELTRFEMFILGPFDDVNAKIEQLQSNLDASGMADEGFLHFTLAHISELKQANLDLLKRIKENKSGLDQLFSTSQHLEDLQKRVCTPDTEANKCKAEDAKTLAMTGSVPNSTCSCIALSDIDCGTMFPSDNASGAASRAQCTMFLGILINHDQQLREIARIDNQQNEMLKNINEKLADLADQVGTVISDVDVLKYKVFILELKAQRGEAGAFLLERVDHILAWATRRTGDVNFTFCHERTNAALNNFDYKSARQNW